MSAPQPMSEAPLASPSSRAGRNLPAAIGVGLLLGALIIGTHVWRKELFLVLATASVSVGCWEIAKAMQRKGSFAAEPAVRDFLRVAGSAGLPLTLVDGVTVATGGYPSRERLLSLAGRSDADAVAVAAAVSTQALPTPTAARVDLGLTAATRSTATTSTTATAVVFMDGGVVVEQGHPKDVINNPQHPRTQTFLRRMAAEDHTKIPDPAPMVDGTATDIL